MASADNRAVLIPSLMFGLHLPLIIALVILYYVFFKPYYDKVIRARKHHMKSGPAPKPVDPNRPTTPLMPVFTIDSPPPKLPSYWTNKAEHIRKINITKEADFIKILVYNLWSPRDVGVGKDATAVGNHKFIKITKVQRVENIPLFLKYDENRLKLLSKEEKIQCFKDLSQLSSSQVRTTELIDRLQALARSPLGKDIHHDLNEHYLFHGTLPYHVKSICRTGLSTFYASRVYFGKGVYTAENPTKSDQYTDQPDVDVQHTDKKLLLCRVCLGELFISKEKAEHLSSPPCRTCYEHECKDHPHTFDSAVGDIPGWRFREFIVYKDYRVYPEYIITYDRVEDNAEMNRFLEQSEQQSELQSLSDDL